MHSAKLSKIASSRISKKKNDVMDGGEDRGGRETHFNDKEPHDFAMSNPPGPAVKDQGTGGATSAAQLAAPGEVLFDLLATITLDLPSGVVAVDEKGIVRVLNLAAGALLRTNRLYALGRSVEKLLPDDRMRQVMDLQGSSLNRTIQIKGRCVKAVSMPLTWGGAMFGAMEVWQDVQEIIEVREQLGRLTEKNILMEEIVDQSFEEFVTVDEEGHIVYISGPTAEKMGLDKRSAEGVDLFSLAQGEGGDFPVFEQKGMKSLLTMTKTKALELLPSLAGSYRVIGICKSFYDCDCSVAQVTPPQAGASRSQPRKRPLGEMPTVTGTKYAFDDIVGHHPAILEAKRIATITASGNSTILIKGESGTGKELFSHAIHDASSRGSASFIKVNCAGIPETLLESELFGYSEGAFTGARKGGKPGKFELAHGGTIFLDEIGDLSMPMQSKLLRTLQEGEVERVGSGNVREVDVRVIVTTKFDLMEKINKGEFREDLYYRLEVVSIRIPPLRERIEDVEELTYWLLRERLSPKFKNNIQSVDRNVFKAFSKYDWPGNIRELENVLEGALNFVSSDVLTLDCLPVRFQSFLKSKTDTQKSTEIPKKKVRKPVDKNAIIEALERNSGNKRRAAIELQISRATLYNKIREYHLTM